MARGAGLRSPSLPGYPRGRCVAFALALGLTLCVGTLGKAPAVEAGNGTRPEEETLRSRITAYWEARVWERYEEEYGFLDPLVREQIPFPRFIKAREPFHVRAFRIEGVEREEGLARVRIRFTFEVILPHPLEPGAPPVRALGPKQDELVEVWIEREGTWYKTLTRPPRL